MQIKPEQIESGGSACGCGRSPTGRCIGWHALTEDQYWDRLREHNQRNDGLIEQEQFPQDKANGALNIREIYG